MDQLLAALYDLAPVSRIQALLKTFSADHLGIPDENNLDVLHHAILAGNVQAVSILLDIHTFRNNVILSGDNNVDRGGDRLCHLHLACLLGNVSVVNVLCTSAPWSLDVRCGASVFPSSDVVRRYTQKGDGRTTATELLDTYDRVVCELMRHTADEVSAVDVAALGRHVSCVHVLLNTRGVSAAKKMSTIARAMEANSMYAFRLLLSMDPDAGDMEEVFKQALSQKQVVFLHALLEHGVDVDRALHGLNPYHVLYMYSSGFHQLSLARNSSTIRHDQGLDEVTAVLLERGFDLHCSKPLGTYPIYSLIAALVLEKDNSPAHVPIYHIRSLDLLLKAGARLNFDELRQAAELSIREPPEDTLSRTAVGRDLFTSALDAYFSCLQSCDTWRPHVMEHLDRVCLSLLERGADADYLDQRGETPLHALMRAMAAQHAMGHMHADLSCMCRMLLYFGADPNRRTTDGFLPVHLYFSVLLNGMGGLFAFRRWRSSDNASQVLQLLYFMDAPIASEACRSITADLNDAKASGSMPDDVIVYVTGLIADYVNCVKSLQELSRLALWKAVSRKLVSLKKLDMPRAFIAAIKELFMLDI